MQLGAKSLCLIQTIAKQTNQYRTKNLPIQWPVLGGMDPTSVSRTAWDSNGLSNNTEMILRCNNFYYNGTALKSSNTSWLPL